MNKRKEKSQHLHMLSSSQLRPQSLISKSSMPKQSTALILQSQPSTHTTAKSSTTPEISIHCQSLEEAQRELERLINEQEGSLIPEPVWCRFVLHTGATFSIDSSRGNAVGYDGRNDGAAVEHGGNGINNINAKVSSPQLPRTAVSIPEVLDVSKDEKKRHEIQIAVGRAIVAALEDVDGFRYARRNNWETKARNGLRIKFVCSESLQNRDRAANRQRKKSSLAADAPTSPHGSGSDGINGEQVHGTTVSKEANLEDGDGTIVEMGAVGMRHKSSTNSTDKHHRPLPTYDCCGNIKIKFLALQQCIEIAYGYNPIHRKVPKKAEEHKVDNVSGDVGSVAPVEEKSKRKRLDGVGER